MHNLEFYHAKDYATEIYGYLLYYTCIYALFVLKIMILAS